jgi:hypothetical protein
MKSKELKKLLSIIKIEISMNKNIFKNTLINKTEINLPPPSPPKNRRGVLK